MTTKRLTALFCETVAAPQGGQVEIRDEVVKGLRLRVSCDGTRAFTMRYRADGTQRRASWSMKDHSLAEARAAALELQRAVRLGLPLPAPKKAAEPAAPAPVEAAPIEAPVEAPAAGDGKARAALPATVGGLADRYIAKKLKRQNKLWRKDVGEIECHIRPRFGERAIGSLTQLDVVEMCEDIAEEYPKAANRALARLRAMYNWGCGRGLVTTGNPTAGIRKEREFSRTRVLSDDELVKVWSVTVDGATLRYPGAEFAQFVALSGQRRDDVRKMHTREINRRDRAWIIPAERYKGKVRGVPKPHLVPLTDTMLAILDSVPHKDGFVFSCKGGRKPYGCVQTLLETLREAAGVDHWVWHDLRRTLRTGIRKPPLRVEREIAELVIGHQVGGKLEQVYDIADVWAHVDEKRAALEAWDGHVRRLLIEAKVAPAAWELQRAA